MGADAWEKEPQQAQERILVWLDDLGSSSYTKREKAVKELSRCDRAILPVLDHLSRKGEPLELRRRARMLAEKLRASSKLVLQRETKIPDQMGTRVSLEIAGPLEVGLRMLGQFTEVDIRFDPRVPAALKKTRRHVVLDDGSVAEWMEALLKNQKLAYSCWTDKKTGKAVVMIYRERDLLPDMKTLIAQLGVADLAQRNTAVRGLASGGLKAFCLLLEALKQDDSRVLAHAAVALGQIIPSIKGLRFSRSVGRPIESYCSEAIRTLRGLMGHSDWRVRAAVSEALVQYLTLRRTRFLAATHLVKALRDSHWLVRYGVVVGVQQRTLPGGSPLEGGLRGLAEKDPVRLVREAAICTIKARGAGKRN